MSRQIDHPLVFGAVGGLAWGILMRLWMRYISTDPEFSWSGTLFILGAATIVGLLLGFARLRRLRGGVGWWRSTALSLALLGAAGAVMWPSVVAGAIAFGRPRPAWLRWVLGVAALTVQIPIIREFAFDNPSSGTVEAAAAVAWYLPMLTVEAWAFSVVVAPRVDGSPTPGRVKRVVLTAPLVIVALAGLVAVGLPSS